MRGSIRRGTLGEYKNGEVETDVDTQKFEKELNGNDNHRKRGGVKGRGKNMRG